MQQNKIKNKLFSSVPKLKKKICFEIEIKNKFCILFDQTTIFIMKIEQILLFKKIIKKNIA